MRELGRRFLDEYLPAHCKGEHRSRIPPPRSSSSSIPGSASAGSPGHSAQRHRGPCTHDMRETPYQANRTLGVLSKIFNLAELWGLRPDGSNPCRHVKRFPRGEARAVPVRCRIPAPRRATLKEIGQDGSENAFSRCRRSSADAHRVPALGNPDAALGACRSRGRRRCDCPTPRPAPRRCIWATRAITGVAGPPAQRRQPVGHRGAQAGKPPHQPCNTPGGASGLDDARIHDLRHSFASGGLPVGEGLPMIDKLLGHTQVQTPPATPISPTIPSRPPRTASPTGSRKSADSVLARGVGRRLIRTYVYAIP